AVSPASTCFPRESQQRPRSVSATAWTSPRLFRQELVRRNAWEIPAVAAPVDAEINRFGGAESQMRERFFAARIADANDDIAAAQQVFEIAEMSGRVRAHDRTDALRVLLLPPAAHLHGQPMPARRRIAEEPVRHVLEPTRQHEINPAVPVEI